MAELRGRGSFDGWSKSSLKSLLEGCSWQWALSKLGGLRGPNTPHSAAGTGMHSAIEYHENARIEGRPIPDLAELLEISARSSWAEGQGIPEDWRRIHGGPDQALEWSLQLTEGWFSSGIRNNLLAYEPVAVEPHLETFEGPSQYSVRGYLDWVGHDPVTNETVVVDFKSASNLSRWKNADHHKLESTIYLYLMAMAGHELQREGSEGIRMEWHVVSRKGDATILEGPRLDNDLIRFAWDLLRQSDELVQNRQWKPNPSWGLCSDRWCAFYHGCQVTGVLTPEVVHFDPPSPVTPPGE
jgi:hypothetical protein